MSSGTLEEQAAQRWCPTHVQITVLQARGLRAKGKHGTNDAFAVMELGRERYATSVLEKTSNPEWKEECTFELPPDALVGDGGGGQRQESHGCVVVVSLMHRSLLGPDKFLGQVSVSISDLYVDKSRRKPEWYTLHSKAGKKEKDRGEVQLAAQFMRNNLTASMFDLSARDKPRSAFGKLKDKVKGRKKGSTSDSSSAVVPGVLRIDSENEDGDAEREQQEEEEAKRKSKGRNFLTLPGVKKSSLTHSSSSSISSSHVSAPSTPDPSLGFGAGAGVGVTTVITPPPVELAGEPDANESVGRRRTRSADITTALPVKEERHLFSGLKPKSESASKSSLCINGSHLYVPEKGSAAAAAGTAAAPNIALSRSLQNLNNAAEQKPSIQKTASVGKADAVKAGFFGDKKAGGDKVPESSSAPEPGKDGTRAESRRSLDLGKGGGLELFDKARPKEADDGKKEDGKKSRLNIKSFVTGANKSESSGRGSGGHNLVEEAVHGTTFGLPRDRKDKVVKVRLDVSPEVETTNLPQSPFASDSPPPASPAAPPSPARSTPSLGSSPMSVISRPPDTPPSVLSQSPPTPASLLSFGDFAEIPRSPPEPGLAATAPGAPSRENNLPSAAEFARHHSVSPPPPPSSPEKVSAKSSNPFFFPSATKNPFLSGHSFNPFLDALCESSEGEASRSSAVAATDRGDAERLSDACGLENGKTSVRPDTVQREVGEGFTKGPTGDSTVFSDLEGGKVDEPAAQRGSPRSSQMQATGPVESARVRPTPAGWSGKQENAGPAQKADAVALAQTARKDDPIVQASHTQSFSDVILGKRQVSSPVRSPLAPRGIELDDKHRSGTGKAFSEEQPTKDVSVQKKITTAEPIGATASASIAAGFQPDLSDKSNSKLYSEVEGADLESSLKINYLDQDETSYFPVKSQLYRPHVPSASAFRSDAAETSPPYLQLSVAEEDFGESSRRAAPSRINRDAPEEAPTDTTRVASRGASDELPVKDSDAQPRILNIEVTTQPSRKYSSQRSDPASAKNVEGSQSGFKFSQAPWGLAEWLETQHAQASQASERSPARVAESGPLADEPRVPAATRPRKDGDLRSPYEETAGDGAFGRTFPTNAANSETFGSAEADDGALSRKAPAAPALPVTGDGASVAADASEPKDNRKESDKAGSSRTAAGVAEQPQADVAAAAELHSASRRGSRPTRVGDTASRVTSSASPRPCPPSPPLSPGLAPVPAVPSTPRRDSATAMPLTAAREFGPSGDAGWHGRTGQGPPPSSSSSSASPLVSASGTRPACAEAQDCDAGISPRSVLPLNASGKKMEDDVKAVPAGTHKDGAPSASALSRLSHPELVAMATRQRAELVRRDDTIRNLHEYIDGLLLRIMEETPHLLLVPYQRAASLGQK